MHSTTPTKLLLILLPAILAAQTPTISSITATGDTNAISVSYQVNTATPYCWVQFGVSSGVYLYSSTSFQGGGAFSLSGLCQVALTGLKDGTTYYVLPTARPDPDDETNICAVSGCGAVEQVVTTLAATVSHLPAPPASVQANMLVEPNTTGADATNIACSPNCYVTVPLAPNGMAECAATSTVIAPPGYSGSIPITSTLTTILSTPALYWWYGTIFELPQGATCTIPSQDSPTCAMTLSCSGAGYTLPVIAVDPLAASIADPVHRFIVFKSHVNASTDFPPFGARTAPPFFANMATFKTYNPNDNDNFVLGSVFNGTSATGQYHHLGWENLQWQVDETQVSANFVVYISFLPNPGRTTNFPQYIFVRGNHFQGEPSRNANLAGNGSQPFVVGAFGTHYNPGMNVAVVGNYADWFWWGGTNGQYSNVFAFTDGDVTGGGPILDTNNFVSGLPEAHYLEVNNFNRAAPHDITVTHNYTYMPTANPNSVAYAQSAGFGSCGRASVELKSGTRVKIDGNYFNGQFACSNYGTPILVLNGIDLVVANNYMTKVASVFSIPGNLTSFRGLSSLTAGNRELWANNFAFNIGRPNFNGGGGGAQTVFAEIDSALDNITIANNTIGQISFGGGAYYPLVFDFEGGGPVAGARLTGNIFPYGQAAFSGIVIKNNSGTPTSHPATPANLYAGSNYTASLATFAGVTDGAAGLGMTATSTIAGGSGYSNGSLSFGNCGSNPTATYTVSGSAVQYSTFSVFGTCTPASFTATAGAGGASLRTHYGLTSSYTWGSNLPYCTFNDAADMSQADCDSFTANWPRPGSVGVGNAGAGDIFLQGANTADREAATGISGLESGDGRCTPNTQSSCFAGANMNAIEQALGIVSHISTAVAATSFSVTYLAPDSRACSVIIPGTGVQTDAGGAAGYRTVKFTGLSASTAYSGYLMCYFLQDSTNAPWFSFPSDPSNLNTSISVTTLAAGNRNIPVSCPISNFSGATSCVATLTPISGSPITCTSTGASCTISGAAAGDYLAVNKWYTSGSVLIGSSDAQTFSVR